MAKKDNSKKSPQKSNEVDITRPISKWRRKECEHFAKQEGIKLKGKTVSQMRKELDNLNKKGEIEFPNDNEHGGARDGAGRKPSAEKERLVLLQERAENHALEEVDVALMSAGGVEMVKKTRDVALLDILFSEGLKNKNITAIREYFDRTRGKARQPVEHSGKIETEDQYIPTDPALQKAHQVYMEETKKLIAQGYYESTDWDDEE